MAHVSGSIEIDRPPAEAFAAAADPFNQLEWDPESFRAVEKLDPGPLGRGSRYRASVKGFGVVEYSFAEYEVGARFAHHAEMPIGGIGHTFAFEPAGAGTRLTQAMDVEPRGLGRLFAPLMPILLGRRIRQINTKLRDHLAAHAGVRS